ncbi:MULTISPECIES: SusC/RagA family TonB-linked outer membrane protein [Sphingobacterium]|uniref:SusC/RagA family TonB-linked outer membrane protein n=2 Tax=Sphingobacteriaceae TaxID=84566 RepID=UPI0010F158EA|nr:MULTISPECIES: TonB-dependent receptor [unclassified Sphingobacterium]MCS3556042.1 TonB-linked SusC/RagA family outer membrane protein [Sphingobacterium sp. JUb21]TCR00323.1 TonB-linked SusC/RagA family outer membrane protein [Sphingobacterium sp. JUb20]
MSNLNLGQQQWKKAFWMGAIVSLSTICQSPVLANPKSLTFMSSTQEKISVSGIVTNTDDGSPIEGVTVSVVGTNIATKTNQKGEYVLTNVPSDGKLNFRMIGMTSTDEEVKGRTSIMVSLISSSANLEEVVVVGYGVQKKETVTGSVVAVKGSELSKSPALNVSNALAGRVPGVIATNGSAEPGYDGSTISIRGTNTLGNSSPLIVIDGIPARQGGFERLNPADIDNISVLKDASAAIYGARAANGVILVTTKRGTNGKPKLSYNFNKGFSQPTVIPKLTDAVEYSELRNELEIYKLPVAEWAAAQNAFKTTGTFIRPNSTTVSAPFTPEDVQLFKDGSDPWGHPNTDWYGETLKNWSPQEKHNVQITGGNDAVKYLTSIGYQNQDAYYKKSATGYKQYDLRINLDAKISKYITTKFGVLGRQENRNFPTKGAGTIFRMLMRGNPTQPAYWPNGMPGPDIENGENPVVITTNETGYERDKRYYFQTNGQIDITIPWIEGLKFSGNAAVDKYIKKIKRWETPWYLYTWQGAYEADGVTPQLVPGKRGPADPRLNQSDEDQLNILLGGVLTYDKVIGDHTFNILAGVNRETIQNDNFSAYRRYFLSDNIDYLFAGGDAEKNNDGSAWQRARLNYFGRVNYNYKSKYIAELLWRYDGSYMFPQKTRYGFFPGAMLGWVASEEKFWKDNIKVVNYFKVRASYGQMGNDNVEYDNILQEYQYFSTYKFGSYILGDEMIKTLYESRVPNNFITWEVANNYNLGIDAQLLGGKINFEFDVFKNRRNSILWRRNASIPQSTGMTLPAENIGKVDNKGWEFNLGYRDQKGDWGYSASINGGYAKNKIVFWDEAAGAPSWQQTTGRVINSGLYYQYDGVFKSQEEINSNTLDYSAITNNLRPGDMKYKDYDGDGKITPDDRVRTNKNTNPTFQGGLNLGLRYKNFDLSILFQGAMGGEVRIATDESGAIGNYLHEFYENRWTIDNPSSEHPRITDRSDQYYSKDNTYWLHSNNYLRLKNVEIGYNLSAKLVERLGISSFRVYASGMNLVTWSKLKMYDPESTNTLGHYYPQARLINTGILLSF